MSAELLAEIEAIDRTIKTGTGNGPGTINLWRAGLHNRRRYRSPSLILPQLIGHQAILARYLSEEVPGDLGGQRLGHCNCSTPCTSAACPVCRALGDAWLIGTCRHLLTKKPHGWIAFGGVILDQDPIAVFQGYTPGRLAAEFSRSLRLLGLDHLDWHGRFAISVQSSVATREDSITISVAAAAATGPYHDLSTRFDEAPLGSLLAFRAAASVEAGPRVSRVHVSWHTISGTYQRPPNRAALASLSSRVPRGMIFQTICG